MLYKTIVKVRSAVLVFLTHHLALPFLQYVRREKPFPYKREELKQLPEKSLGYELVHFLGHKKLELLPFYVRHDIKHILLQYDTTDEGEVCLQSFMLGNGHFSFPVLATVLYGIFTMPEYWKKFWKAYCRGKAVAPIEDWNWFSIIELPTIELRKKIEQPKIKF